MAETVQNKTAQPPGDEASIEKAVQQAILNMMNAKQLPLPPAESDGGAQLEPTTQDTESMSFIDALAQKCFERGRSAATQE